MDFAIIGAAFAQSINEARTPFTYGFMTYVWVIGWSVMGGVVSFMQKLKAGQTRAFNLAEFIGEIVTSGFVGILTFWLCEWANVDKMLSAVFVAVTGHMGSRALFFAERSLEKWFASKMGVCIKDKGK